MTTEEYLKLQLIDNTHHYPTFWDSGKGLVNLTKEGRLVVIDKNGRRERDWYKDAKSGKPWFPKHKNFKSLVKQIIRDDGEL
jgi:hypothetical protein